MQTFLANKAAGYLKTKYNVEASIGALKIILPNRVEIKDLYIADDHNDTLIYAQDFGVHYNGFNQLTNTLNITKVDLDNGRLYLRKYAQDSLFNFGYFLKKFAPENPDPNAEDFRMKIGKVNITEFRFDKHRLGCTDSCTNIFLRQTRIDVSNFFLNGDYVTGDINHLSFTDTARFKLYEFRAKAAYQAKYIGLKDLYFRTDESEVNGWAFLDYKSDGELGDFLEKVGIRAKFNQSTFSSAEFQSYIPQFPNFDVVKITGEFNGTVNDFEGTNCVIDLGERTHFFGDMHIKNPTETEDLFIETSIGEVRTTPYEFRKYAGQFIGEMEWMTFLDQFNSVKYRGKYIGTVKDFDVKGWFKLDENEVSVDAKMNNFNRLEHTTYKGKIAAQKLNIQDFLPDSPIHYSKFNASLQGKGLTAKSLAANVEGKIDYIEINNYAYKNVTLNGEVKKGEFDGVATMRDPNANFDFEGKVDFSQDTVVVDFLAEIIDVNAHALGFLEEPISVVNFTTAIDFSFYKSEWWEGDIDLFGITYEGVDRFYFFDSVRVSSKNINLVHHDKVTSRLLTAELDGEYSFAEVYQAFYAEYLEFNRLDTHSIAFPDVHFTFNLNLLNTELLTDLFLPDLNIESGTKVTGQYNKSSELFDIKLNSEKIEWKLMDFEHVELWASQQESAHELAAKIGNYSYKNQNVDSINVKGNWREDSVNFAVSGVYRDSIDSHFRVKGIALKIDTAGSENYYVSFTDGRFNVGYNFFNLLKDNYIYFANGEVEMQNIGFYDKESYIVVHGYNSEDPTKVMRVNVANLSADLLNYLLRNKALDFKGKMSGDVILGNDEGVPLFASELLVDSLWVNNDYIGALNMRSNWVLESSSINIDAEVKRDSLLMMQVAGNYHMDSIHNLDFNIHFNRFRLMWLDPFLEGILQNIRGTVTGDIALNGTLDNINTKGELLLQKAALSVPYFNTDYTFDGAVKIQVEKEKIILPRSAIRDVEGNTGFVYGNVFHTNYSDWIFDLESDTKNLLVLNTENSADALFYGKGYVEGDFSLSGPLDDLNIGMNIKTNRGTDFKIPFSNPVNVGSQSFVTYTGSGSIETIIIDPDKIKQKEMANLGGLDISINADITPDASIELVMDETVGDIIRGRGNGNLRIEIPHNGDMEMYGTVEVTSGDYLFTMQNIINKKFVILPGGTITWQGNPYDATMKMKAKYSTRTTLTGIVQNNYDGQRVQVDLIMDLNGIVTNPNINFDIKLPNSNRSYQEELNNRLSDPDKLNVQAFSLLVINSFWTESLTTEGNLIGQGAGSNTMQMASAQFSNWLAQGIGDYIDISVGYNTSLEEQQRDEIEVDISKSFLDDRVTINSQIDMPVGASAESGNAQNFTGDIEVVYKITRDGRIRAKAFNRNNQDNPALDKLSPYTYGVGVFYQTSFNTYGDLFRKIFGIKPKETQKEEQNTETETGN